MLKHEVFNSKPYKTVVALAQKEGLDLYLVGGFPRDLILGRRKASLDLDFSLASGAIHFGRKVAKVLRAGFVVLDKEHGCCRVVCKSGYLKQVLTFDFVDFRGKTLKEDLEKRDFTLNTLAIKVPFKKEGLLDYLKARRDMEKKLVRVVGAKSFDEDPLRILRAFSLSAIFGFKITPTTMRLIEKKKELLKNVSGERIRDELFKILAVEDACQYIKLMDKFGVLKIVIPQIGLMHNVRQGGYHHLDVWGHSLETVKKLEELLLKFSKDHEVGCYLNHVMASDRTRRQLIKLAALLHDIGKPRAFEVKAGKTMFHGHERIGRIISDAVSANLKLSTKERFAMDTIIFWHLRPGYLADNKVLTKRAVFRYFRDTREEAVSVLLVSIADQRATRGPLATKASRLKHEKVSFALIKRYFEMLKEKPFVRLINGKDLIRNLKLKPGPLFSIILDAVEEAQAEGKVKIKQEALSLAKKVFQQQKKSYNLSGARPAAKAVRKSRISNP
ncbi:MAG: HD domain-containing protein [Candidatus Omnitrophota bacterium]